MTRPATQRKGVRACSRQLWIESQRALLEVVSDIGDSMLLRIDHYSPCGGNHWVGRGHADAGEPLQAFVAHLVSDLEDAKSIEGEIARGIDVHLPSVLGVHLERHQ